jgi:hypothetical protein
MRVFYTIRQVRFIEDNYQKLSDKQIALILGKNYVSIRNFRHRNHLIKARWKAGVPKGYRYKKKQEA